MCHLHRSTGRFCAHIFNMRSAAGPIPDLCACVCVCFVPHPLFTAWTCVALIPRSNVQVLGLSPTIIDRLLVVGETDQCNLLHVV